MSKGRTGYPKSPSYNDTSGIITQDNSVPKNEKGKPICCKGCGRSGGTLLKTAPNEYRHQGCGDRKSK